MELMMLNLNQQPLHVHLGNLGGADSGGYVMIMFFAHGERDDDDACGQGTALPQQQ